MTDFYDWLTAADTGLTADRLAQSFRLSQEEMRRATEALAPAFTDALRRTMGDPASLGQLGGAFAPFADPRLLGLGEPALAGPARILAETLFGSAERTAALARRASLPTGIAPDTLRRLIAGLSVLTVETLVHMMAANLSRNAPTLLAGGLAPAAGFGGESYGTALAESMRRGANAVEALSRPSDQPAPRRTSAPDLQRMFGEALNGWLPFLPPAPPRPEPRPSAPAAEPDPFLPFNDMLAAFGRGLSEKGPAAAPAASARERAPAAPPPQRDPAPSAGALDAFFESGRRMQDDYLREMSALFSRYQQAPDGADAPPSGGDGRRS